MTKQLGYPEPSEYHRARHGDDVILKRNPGMAESLPRLEYDPASGKFVQAGTGLKQFCGVGAKNIPRVLEVFGDAIRSIGEMPPTFQERRVTTLGRTWDIEAAKELGGFRVLDDPNWTIEGNYAWLKEAIENGDVFYLASPVTEANLLGDPRYGGVSVFMRELDLLRRAGYHRIGDYLLPPR